MAKPIAMGSKIRRLRKERGMTQVILADKLGISASYLNLIEHNRRTLTVQLLLSFSQILNIDPQIFSPKQDGRLASEVAEVLKDPLFKDLDFSDIDPSILVIDAPTLCSALTKSYNAWHSASNNLQVLSERVAQNPILSQSSYRLRTLLTSIMSFSEILHDNSDLEPAERKNFLKIVMNESESLSETVTEMLGFVSGKSVV